MWFVTVDDKVEVGPLFEASENDIRDHAFEDRLAAAAEARRSAPGSKRVRD
jgi:hypothetical protein